MQTHFEVLRGTSAKVEVTDGRNKGVSNEKASLRRLLAPGRCDVIDRGYKQFFAVQSDCRGW